MAETPRHVRATNRTSMSVGSFTKTIDTPEDPFTARVMAFRNDDASELEDNPENWPAEKVKAAAEMFQRNDKAAQDRLENQQIADSFVAAHKEYLDTKANGALLNHEMNVMFGPGAHPLEHFEAAYESLKASNFLKLDAKELARQKKVADGVRYATEKARNVAPSEQELYSMPLEDLRRLDAMENHNRMLRRGEEGGW